MERHLPPNVELLRGINERVVELSRGEKTFLLLCECGDGYCVEQVGVTRARFEEIRRSNDVVLAPRHRLQQ